MLSAGTRPDISMAGVPNTLFDFTVHTVDPPHNDPRGIQQVGESDEDAEGALTRPCKPRPVSLGAFHNTVLLVVLMGRNSPLTEVHFEQLIALQKKHGDRGSWRQRGAMWCPELVHPACSHT